MQWQGKKEDPRFNMGRTSIQENFKYESTCNDYKYGLFPVTVKRSINQLYLLANEKH